MECGDTDEADAADAFAWVDWTDATVDDPGSAGGRINFEGSWVAVAYYGDVHSSTQTSGGTDYWRPRETFVSEAVDEPPPPADLISLRGGNTYTYSLSFSPPLRDPVLAILSLGNTSNEVRYEFDDPFVILGGGANAHWGGSTVYDCGTNTLCGLEGNGIILFSGTFSSIQWTVPVYEGWHGITVGGWG